MYCFLLVIGNYFVASFCCTSLFLVLQSECTKLEVENARFEKQLGELHGQTAKTSSKINLLVKENLQLKSDMEKAMVYYESSAGWFSSV
jgi:peptidoglycan hydrolase CwlO-like protein